MENNEYKLEEGLNKMIDDLNMADDEFINSYFEEDLVTNNDEKDIEVVVKKEEPSFNLEVEKKDILTEIDDFFKLGDTKEVVCEEEKILKIIDNSANASEFFETFEKGI